jgi:hypothetical protein
MREVESSHDDTDMYVMCYCEQWAHSEAHEES